MKHYTTINNLLGWLMFIISLGVFFSTLEPTVSLWDCGEFISTSFKLEVGHPPGAPLFLLLARIFSLFSPDNHHVAMMINSLSCIASAYTILFLFWTITHLVRRVLLKTESDYSLARILVVFSSGIVGTLSFCFSDSFWFSAVEAEVYGMSSFFTALTIWAMLKWEDELNQKYSNRWLVLISYLLGLSIGIHLLNLLVIPPLVCIYFYNKYKFTWFNFAVAIFISFFLLLGVLYFVIPGNIKLASLLELFIVNSFGLPYNSGLLIYCILLSCLLIFGLTYTYRKKAVFWNTFMLCFSMILLGYGSYAMIVIRANTNVPINTNKPNNAVSLLYYLQREQYGTTPLLYGPFYNAPIIGTKEKYPIYEQKDGKYEIVSYKRTYVYDDRFMTLFPRMYSTNSNHIEVYKGWGNIKGIPTRVKDQNGEIEIVRRPSFANNLGFFIKYQIGYMYFRYFMWNFAGKQNDLQGNNGIMFGNWISGFNFIDKHFIGPQDKMPSYLKNNTGCNRFFFLPLLLGLMGLVYQSVHSRRYFLVVLFLFIMTGIAIAVYTNQTPLQPRERDYAYTGSFYAFSIWIGYGVLLLYNWLAGFLSKINSSVIAGGISMGIPLLLISQNWDDHDRSNRYIVRDIAYNYLMSCAPNAILFTAGDNDTFPLWYMQEVEGVRRDVRVVNLMLLNADWYIDQMNQTQYESKPLPITLTHEQFVSGKREIIYVLNKDRSPVNLKEAIKRVSDENSNSKIEVSKDVYAEYIPSRELILPVDKKEALSNGALKTDNADLAEDSIQFTLPGNYLGKSELIVLDILAHFGWKRPIYFTTLGFKGSLGLEHYMQLEGFAYRLVPIYCDEANYQNYGRIEAENLFKLLMQQFRWRNWNNKNVLRDDHIMKTLSLLKIRNTFARLALSYAGEGNFKRGIEVLDRCIQILPPPLIPYDIDCIRIADAYYKCGAINQANFIATGYNKQLISELNYYNTLNSTMKDWTQRERNLTLLNLRRLKEMLELNGQINLLKQFENN
jgi:hypothetical protein